MKFTKQPRFKCETCGKVCKTHCSRPKFCKDCNPYKTGGSKPKKYAICKVCGVAVCEVPKQRQILNTELCEKCAPTYLRKEKASDIKWERGHKKLMSKFGKYLIEEAEKGNKMFTSMRYVSREEITNLGKKLEANFDYRYCCVEVFSAKSINHVDSISHSGFYRVEKYYKFDKFFIRASQTGLPNMFMGNNVWLGRECQNMSERFREYQERKKDEAFKKMEEIIENKKRLRFLNRIRNRQSSKQFFNALAMAGAIK